MSAAFFYSRRSPTWPIPWGQAVHPVEMFYESDPDRFLDQLGKYSIDAVLLPKTSGARQFNDANYPQSFLSCVARLVEDGRLERVWESEALEIVARAKRRGESPAAGNAPPSSR